MKIVVDRDIPFLKGVLEPFAEVVCLAGSAISAADVRDADALVVRTRTRCNAALLAGSRVRFIATATIGSDHIDLGWCSAHGVTVCTSAGCNKRGVLQWVAAALAHVSERSTRTDLGPKSKWPAAVDANGEEGVSTGRTLGVVGVGNVGSLVAEYAASWGFRVMRSDPPRERTEGLGPEQGFFSLAEIAARADIITLHVPLTDNAPDATRHLIGREFFAKTKPETIILNSSRGAVIEPTALREASTTRRFVLDVWNNEPAVDRVTLENSLLATPHIAGYTLQGKANATAMAVNQLARHFGLPIAPIPLQTAARAISWNEMRAEMPARFDIAAESRALKAAPQDFEKQRDDYNFRSEFF